MAVRLRPGFKAEAERLALAIRAEMGLAPDDRLDCRDLAGYLGIPIASLRELADDAARAESIQRLLGKGSGFSALTVCAGTRRLIVYNQRQPPGRRTSSLAHELAHILLEHPPVAPAGEDGRQVWDAELEAEADWQAGALLVPREGALAWLRRERGATNGERHFGVSRALFSWRLHQTGAARQFNSAAHRLRGRPAPLAVGS
ncbi:MAG: ImmA/IrrE family metallo-endopeptidase [Chloroflexota bacterium]